MRLNRRWVARSLHQRVYSRALALFEPIPEALDRAGVRYVVVGGVAAVLHGHPRLTADLDLAIDLAPEPAAATITALPELGFSNRAGRTKAASRSRRGSRGANGT